MIEEKDKEIEILKGGGKVGNDGNLMNADDDDKLSDSKLSYNQKQMRDVI